MKFLDFKSYCDYVKSIKDKFIPKVLDLIHHSFYDEGFDFMICHVDDTIELVDFFGESYLLYSAKIIDTSCLRIASGMYSLEGVENYEILFLPPNAYIFNMLFGNDMYLSISFHDVDCIRREGKRNELPKHEKIKFHYYEGVNKNVGSTLYNDLDVNYQIQLIDNKNLFPYNLFNFFSECSIRLNQIKHIIKYYDGDVEIVFCNNVSLFFTRVIDFCISAPVTDIDKEFNIVQVWNDEGKFLLLGDHDVHVTEICDYKNDFLWLYEELYVTDDQTYKLLVRTSMFSFAVTFADFILYNSIVKSWINKEGQNTNCPYKNKTKLNISRNMSPTFFE